MTAHHRHPLDRLRVSPPPDDDWPSDATVQHAVTLDLPEGFLDATGTYDVRGDLLHITIGKADLPADQVKLMCGEDRDAFAAIARLDPATVDDLLRQAAEDEAGEYADWVYENWGRP